MRASDRHVSDDGSNDFAPASLSPLADVHHRGGATMVSRHDHWLAASFGSPATEAAVCLASVGIADRSDRGTLELRGAPDDIDSALLELSVGARAWFTWGGPRSAIVRCEHDQRGACQAAVRRTDGAACVDVSDRYAAIAVVGPKAAELLEGLSFDPANPPITVSEGANSFELLIDVQRGPMLWAALLTAGAPLHVASVGLDAIEHLTASHRFS
jgi:glycine cleavage system aminomethyltransferase T